VLIIAEECNPEWTSVPLVGWSHYEAIARVTKAHLITQIRNRDAIVRAGLVEGVDFTAIDSEKVAGPAFRVGHWLSGGAGKGWTTKQVFNRFGRVYFERLMWNTFGPRLKQGEFDVVHQLTPLSPTLPAKMASRCKKVGVPFVWGPINGGLAWPKGFESAIRSEREWLSKVRSLHTLMPGYRSTRKNSSAILIGSTNTFAQMPARYHDKSFYLPENAIDPRRFSRERTHRAAKPIRIVYLGRVVPYKGVDILIDAAEPLLRSGEVTLDIIGEGPLKESLQAQVSNLKLESAVTFLGHVGHDTLQQKLSTYDVLGFPSIREFGGAVVLEAMALGVVPIVPNYGGIGELVTDATGWRIPLGSRDELVSRFRSTLESIVADPSQIEARSTRGIRRAREQFTWDAKAKRVVEVYDWVLKRREKPDFPMPIPDVID
jgi:glycosyltransferase involved in cell wall biosynthesis